MNDTVLWDKFRKLLFCAPGSLFSLDVSRMDGPEGWPLSEAAALGRALDDLQGLESGALANPDEGRQVGHYWLRAPERAPEAALAAGIRATLEQVERFAEDVLGGVITPASGSRFRHVLSIGIGGSALGPQFVSDALAPADPPLGITFLDNTDPDGFDRALGRIEGDLARTLVLVISKSGGTAETRNALEETYARFEARGLDFPRHAVAITAAGSELDLRAEERGWLARFPMWDWVGGRTSEFSAVGLLPAALQGIPIRELLGGAAAMDELGRGRDILANPAALLAAAWMLGSGGDGRRDLVVIPYKDRLQLLSRYLQQLVMESLGKREDLRGDVVEQGLTVYGNKGSTDQHAYVQQLRDGVANFFVMFIRVLKDRRGASPEIEPDTTAGDYLDGFLLGTRQALTQKGRPSITVTIPEVSPWWVGGLIALFERTVGLYASLIGVNAYNQPGVEAGKQAASRVLAMQRRLLATLRGAAAPLPLDDLIGTVGTEGRETAYHVLTHLAANGRLVTEGDPDAPFALRYAMP